MKVAPGETESGLNVVLTTGDVKFVNLNREVNFKEFNFADVAPTGNPETEKKIIVTTELHSVEATENGPNPHYLQLLVE